MKTHPFLTSIALSALCVGLPIPASAQIANSSSAPGGLPRLGTPPSQYLRPATLEITTKAPADKKFNSPEFRRQLAGFGLSGIIADAIQGSTKPEFSLVSSTGFGVDAKALNPVPADFQLEGQIVRYGYEQGGGAFGLGAARSYTFSVRVALQLKVRNGDSFVPTGPRVEGRGRVTKKGQVALFSAALDASTLREATVLAFANAVDKNDGRNSFLAPLYVWRTMDAPSELNQGKMEAKRFNRVAFFPKDEIELNEEAMKNFPVLKMRRAFVDIDDFSERALSVTPAGWDVRHLSAPVLRYFAAAHRANSSLDNLTKIVDQAPQENPATDTQGAKVSQIEDVDSGDAELIEAMVAPSSSGKSNDAATQTPPDQTRAGQAPLKDFDDELRETLNSLDYIFYARLSDFSIFKIEKDNKRQIPYATVGIELCAIDPRRPTAGYVSVIGTGTMELPTSDVVKAGDWLSQVAQGSAFRLATRAAVLDGSEKLLPRLERMKSLIPRKTPVPMAMAFNSSATELVKPQG